MVFTDPPYNVPVAGHVSGLGAVKHREFVMASGEITPREFTAFLSRSLGNLAAIPWTGPFTSFAWIGATCASSSWNQQKAQLDLACPDLKTGDDNRAAITSDGGVCCFSANRARANDAWRRTTVVPPKLS